MPVEFIGMISTRNQPELRSSRGSVIDPAYVRRFARAHEDAEFDRVLIGYGSSLPDGEQVAAYAAAHTERPLPAAGGARRGRPSGPAAEARRSGQRKIAPAYGEAEARKGEFSHDRRS
jgi:Luciferase-like monooxygenase